MPATRTLTQRQQDRAARIVAAWLGPHLGYDGPCPISREAANNATGVQLIRDWDWPSRPTPTLILEGGPEDWAIVAAAELREQLGKVGVFAEPYAAWALCLYRDDH